MKAISVVSALKAPRTARPATDVVRLVTSAVTALRAVVVPLVLKAVRRSATSVVRLATSHVTAPIPMVETASVATAAVAAADSVVLPSPRLATRAVDTATFLATASTEANVITAARTVTSLETAPRSPLAERRSATSASNLVTSRPSAPTKAVVMTHSTCYETNWSFFKTAVFERPLISKGGW
ncbi:hypothetical protein F4775DRAFT_257554 [Biscogniauxia sp. FL1348]|nr:hypothetical protein F4775DRAFT_257554 [Biscogniauxia sp. FL1348]